jgi:nicotinate (nicotinamide) nucleotide adenylyltransferase
MKLEKQIGDFLRAKGQTLSIAESCTGGLVSDRITDVPGSSDYFRGGIVSYSIEAKARHLGIPPDEIKRYGVVSAQVAKKMARGVRKAFRAGYGVSTTGVAGPGGGTVKTPVGTVFIGFSDGKKTFAMEAHFKGGRREVKEQAAEKALRILYQQLIDGNAEEREGNGAWITEIAASKESKIVLVRKARGGISGGKGRLGIFPASFNPPTRAHLALVREAKKVGTLDEILVLLDIGAMDKTPGEAKYEDRLQMVRMLFQKDPSVSIGLSNRGRFLDKLNALRASYPSPWEFTFMVGFDTILRVMDEKYYRDRDRELDRLFDECRFLVANRGDLEQEAFVRLFRRQETRKYRNKVSFFTLPLKFSTLSSTLIRERIRQSHPIEGWVPESTRRFIREKGLYQERPCRR